MSKRNRRPKASFKQNPPVGSYSVEQVLQRAAQQLEAGDIRGAEINVRQVLQAQPDQPFALHLLGVIAHQVGQTAEAVALIERATEILPSEALFHRNVGEMYRLINRLYEAIRHGKRAVELMPKDAFAHANLGIAYCDREEYDKAEASLRRALKINPNLPYVLNNMGNLRRMTEDADDAMVFYRKALAVAPDYLEARNNLAMVLIESDRPDEALAELTQVLNVRPDYAAAHYNAGNALMCQKQHERAWMAYDQALKLGSGSSAALRGMARARREQMRIEEAIEFAQRALALDPGKTESRALLADLYLKDGRQALAEEAYRGLLETEPSNTDALLGLARVYLELGRMEDSRSCIRQAMELDPEDVVPHVMEVQTHKVEPGDVSLKRIESEAESSKDWPQETKTAMHFALGKAYDDLRDYDKAFPHFLEACRLKRSTFEYDAENHDLACRNIAEFFDSENLERLGGAGDPSSMPIFVLGMPRSGTTLVETIVASHPDVFAAGELPHLLRIARQPREDVEASGYPLSMRDIAKADLMRMGERYVTELRELSAGARRVTDKMPANFMALGLIRLMLPNAKIVHVMRNAADVCLSNFTIDFSQNQPHSYDLAEMGRYYVAYARLMEHWRSVLPAGSFLDVQYEELVAEPENQIRRLIDYCGLEWNDACLEHYKTERSVNTASVTQVREPMYKTSVERWRRYERFLEPLFDSLDEFALPR